MANAAVFLPDHQRVPEAVLREEARLLERDGAWHVQGRYYQRSSDAAVQRRWLAEENVRREKRRLANKCGWCEKTFLESDERVNAGLTVEVHATVCLAEFEYFTRPRYSLRLVDE